MLRNLVLAMWHKNCKVSVHSCVPLVWSFSCKVIVHVSLFACEPAIVCGFESPKKFYQYQ